MENIIIQKRSKHDINVCLFQRLYIVNVLLFFNYKCANDVVSLIHVVLLTQLTSINSF